MLMNTLPPPSQKQDVNMKTFFKICTVWFIFFLIVLVGATWLFPSNSTTVGQMNHLLGNTYEVIMPNRQTGTAFWVSPYHLLTACHVVAGPYQEILVRNAERTKAYKTRVKMCNSESDFAILATDWPVPDIDYAQLSHSRMIFGEEVLSAGYGYGLSFKGKKGLVNLRTVYPELSVDTMRTVSMIVNPGDSGSPVLNPRGEVVGIVNSQYSIQIISGRIGVGAFTFVLPIADIRSHLKQQDYEWLD